MAKVTRCCPACERAIEEVFELPCVRVGELRRPNGEMHFDADDPSFVAPQRTDQRHAGTAATVKLPAMRGYLEYLRGLEGKVVRPRRLQPPWHGYPDDAPIPESPRNPTGPESGWFVDLTTRWQEDLDAIVGIGLVVGDRSKARRWWFRERVAVIAELHVHGQLPPYSLLLDDGDDQQLTQSYRTTEDGDREIDAVAMDIELPLEMIEKIERRAMQRERKRHR